MCQTLTFSVCVTISSDKFICQIVILIRSRSEPEHHRFGGPSPGAGGKLPTETVIVWLRVCFCFSSRHRGGLPDPTSHSVRSLLQGTGLLRWLWGDAVGARQTGTQMWRWGSTQEASRLLTCLFLLREPRNLSPGNCFSNTVARSFVQGTLHPRYFYSGSISSQEFLFKEGVSPTALTLRTFPLICCDVLCPLRVFDYFSVCCGRRPKDPINIKKLLFKCLMEVGKNKFLKRGQSAF